MADTEDLLSGMYRDANHNDRRTMETLRQATPYRFDNQAVDLMVQYMLSLKHDFKAIERTRTLARAPQNVMWLEWDNMVFTRTQERIAGRLTEMPEEIPPRRGYVVRARPESEGSEYTVIPVVELAQTGKILSLPFGLALNTQGPVFRAQPPLPPELQWINNLENEWNEGVRGDVLWSCLGTPKDLARSAEVRFANTLTESLVRLQKDKGQSEAEHVAREILKGVINTVHGFAKTVVTMLCLLNEVPIRKTVYIPAGHFRSRGTLKPFLKNQIITLNLEKGRKAPLKVVTGLVREAAWRCRAHMVKGYWRCDLTHGSGSAPGENWVWQWSRRYRRECWQIWIKPHQRGDAALGWVNQEYEVTR